MTQIENRINQISRHKDQIGECLEKLLAEYHEREKALQAKLDETKKRIKDGRLSKSEQDHYKQLSELLNSESPLSVLVRMFRTQETEDGFSVLSSGGDRRYDIPVDLSFCPCLGFAAKRQCSHLEGVRALTRLKYSRKVTSNVTDQN